jgi:hypothetical protein
MTLTQAAGITKRSMVIFACVIFLGLTAYIGYRIWYANYLAHLPPVEEKPDVKFGLLPAINLPSSAVTSSNFSYSIDTTTGGLPVFAKVQKVYFIPKPIATLLTLDKIKSLAKKLAMEDAIATPSGNSYFFQKDDRSLTVEADTGNFSLNGATISGKLQIEDRPVQNFKNLLSSIGYLKEDLANGPSKIAVNQIQLWPAQIDKNPILHADFNKGLISATLTDNGQQISDYQSIQYIYWPVDRTTYSTYPVKSADEALVDLKSGKGSIVIEPTSPQVSITSVYLAYFESTMYQPYLEPIYVFEGPGFVSYVPAVREEYISPAI